MNKFMVMLVAAFVTASAPMAYAGYKEFRADVLADKTLTPAAKEELKQYFDKEEAMFKAQKLDRKQLKDKLSPEAKKALYQHRKKHRKSRAVHHKKTLDKSEVKQ